MNEKPFKKNSNLSRQLYNYYVLFIMKAGATEVGRPSF